MQVLWHIDLVEMLSDLMVTMFVFLLAASIVLVASMVMFPLIDLVCEKAKSVPKDADSCLDFTNHARSQLSGSPWLALRAHFSGLNSEANSQLSDLKVQRAAIHPLMVTPYHAETHPPLGHITPITNRSLAPKRAETLRLVSGGVGQSGLEVMREAGRFTPIFLPHGQDPPRQPIAVSGVARLRNPSND